jgi:hypothetical protein
MEKRSKLRKLPYTGDVSDYRVNLRELNHTVSLVGQALQDQIEAQLSEILLI